MRRLWMVLTIGALALAGCGGGASSDGAGNADRGKSLYEQSVIGSASAPGCKTCHTLDGSALVGPSHQGLATRAAEIIKSADYTGTAKTVEEYLTESIMTPDAYVEKGFTPGVMYANYGKDLSEQEIKDLVAYMASLK
jgi:cytochrome c553